MLPKLRDIVQEVNDAKNLEQVVEVLARRVRKVMGVDVCSIYLTDYTSKQHVLMATQGLKKGSIGSVRLGFDEGLVGVLISSGEPLNLDDAPSHPEYRYFETTGEEKFHGFLGVPIIQHRQVLGGLIVQQIRERQFTEEELSFMVMLAAQLAGTIAHAESNDGLKNLLVQTSAENVRFDGLSGGPGVAIGTAVIVYPPSDLNAVPDREAEDIELEVEAFEKAIQSVLNDIEHLSERMGDTLPAEEKVLFDAYAMMLSGSLVSDTIKNIRDGSWAQGALRETIHRHMYVFEEMEDPYLRERSHDVHDLGRRVLEYLQVGAQRKREYLDDTILVGEEIAPAHVMDVPMEKLRGVVSGMGSSSSHVAILARAMGVPAVMGINDQPLNTFDGAELIVDGYRGRVFVQPSEVVRKEFSLLIVEEDELTADLQKLKGQPAVTPDGFFLPLYVNTGLLSDITPSMESGADGVGLYRTEFPFMVSDDFPSEQQQYKIYRQVLESFAPRPVTLRTLDAGGDKPLPYFPINEDNPFLGWRGIRISLEEPEIFVTQLRAMLRANQGLNNLRLLLPMISGVDEVDEAMALLERARRELLDEGESTPMPQVGVMVEVPSAVYQSEAIAKRVDFLSVGSNDLTQYLLAVDRNNSRVAHLFDSLHPAVLQALAQVVNGAHLHGKRVSVCGEMAGDPRAAILLMGLGIDSLSMSVSSLPRIKWVIRSFSRDQASTLLRDSLACEDVRSVRRIMNAALEEAGLGGLVRAGR